MFEVKEHPRAIRHRLGLNQTEFWSAIGVTQSGGSRYETRRAMAKPVRALLQLVHIDRVDLSKITKADMDIIWYLKRYQPALYRTLKAESRGKR